MGKSQEKSAIYVILGNFEIDGENYIICEIFRKSGCGHCLPDSRCTFGKCNSHTDSVQHFSS